jgi:hypothetical protein
VRVMMSQSPPKNQVNSPVPKATTRYCSITPFTNEACQTHLNQSEPRKQLDRLDRDDTQQVDKQQERTNKQSNLSPIPAAFSFR